MGNSTQALEIPATEWDSLLGELSSSGILTPTDTSAISLSDEDYSFLQAQFHHFKSERSFSPLYFQEYAPSIALGLLILLSRRLFSAPHQRDIWSIADAAAYVQEHYYEQFTLEFFRPVVH